MAAIIKGISDFVMSCVRFFQDLVKKIRNGDIFGGDESTTAANAEDVVA